VIGTRPERSSRDMASDADESCGPAGRDEARTNGHPSVKDACNLSNMLRSSAASIGSISICK
jgi:hypothetical protein